MNDLRNNLTEALLDIYRLESLDNLKIFLEGEIGVLFLLCQSGVKELSPSDISMRLNITKGRVTALLNALRKKDYIIITINDKDRRMLVVRLSEKGDAFIKQKMDSANLFLDRVINLVGMEKIQTLVVNINEVIDKLKEEV